jgi:hypothetical protein
VLIAARNEEDGIEATLQRLANLSYAGPLEVVLGDEADAVSERSGASLGIGVDSICE